MKCPLEEYYVLSEMREAAEREGLWLEVKESYDFYRESNGPVESARCALYDWDI